MSKQIARQNNNKNREKIEHKTKKIVKKKEHGKKKIMSLKKNNKFML